MLRHFLNPPNWFTSASLFCGMFAVVLATGVQGEPNFYRAGLMILFAAVFDMLDGRVARLTGTASQFGTQLDSLVDMVSFGLAPAVLLYAWGLDSLGTLGLAGAFVFALCGAFRLARFNLQATTDVHHRSEGLAITIAGSMVAVAVMAHASTGRTSVEHPVNVWVLTLLLALLMVSQIPYRTFKTHRLSRITVAALALGFGVILAIAVRYNFSIAFVLVIGTYVVSGPLEMVLFGRGERSDLFDFDSQEGIEGVEIEQEEQLPG
ncbi:MAG: CDP-diacylglycerol--serine O-phosphatidyltransferase [Myxococcota bacterium]|jgi:CDP-diacylglycerol--serine O-phosphatidyltransferase|nr:CDP-diacylglycerol--serine O-phosphatidyltransferase [Myxococcota bacterium]